MELRLDEVEVASTLGIVKVEWRLGNIGVCVKARVRARTKVQVNFGSMS
jgi:hypothetical protein